MGDKIPNTIKDKQLNGKKIVRKLKILFWANVLAGVILSINLIVGLCLVLTEDNRAMVLLSTDFINLEEDTFFIKLKTYSYEISWLAVAYDVVTIIGHFFVAFAIPYLSNHYAKLMDSKTATQTVNNVYTKIVYDRKNAKERVQLFPYYSNVFSTGSNPLRWIEYSITAGVMTWIVASLSGYSNAFGLALIFFCNIWMQLSGYSFEQDNLGFKWPLTDRKVPNRRRVDWYHFIEGFIPFIIIWAIILTYFFVALASDSKEVPVFVWFAIFGILALYCLFPLNMVLHYTQIFPWIDKNSNYELTWIFLSITAKSFLYYTLLIGSVTRGDLKPV